MPRRLFAAAALILSLSPAPLAAQSDAPAAGPPPAVAAPVRSFDFKPGDQPTFRLGPMTFAAGAKLDVDVTRAAHDLGGGLEIARQRVSVGGTLFDRVEFEVERELADESNPWRDVFVEVRLLDALAVRAGRFKAPFSRAQTTSSLKLDFAYRPLAAEALAPGRQIGVLVDGSLLGKRLAVEAGLFRERQDRDPVSGELRQPQMAAARVSARPFRRRSRLVEGIEVGAAATIGDLAEGLASVTGRTHVDRSDFFPEVYVSGRRLRTGYELGWSAGPARLAGEYLEVRDQRRGQGIRGNDLPDLVARGWYLSGTWLLLGDRRDSRLPVLAPFGGGGGALEIGARIEALRFASGTPGEAPLRSPRAAHQVPNADRAVTLGLNYFFSRFARVVFDVTGERIEDPVRSPAGAHRIWSAVTRFQFHL